MRRTEMESFDEIAQHHFLEIVGELDLEPGDWFFHRGIVDHIAVLACKLNADYIELTIS